MKSLTLCKASAGSGKTFTLAAHYVALLLSGESFRSILAVTFTNKATEEMKKRILTYLYAIANGQGGDFLAKVQTIRREMGTLSDHESDLDVAQRAKQQYEAILADYDRFNISTIDAFLQVLLQGMAYTIGTAAGYTVDIDSDHAIRLAVEQLLSTHIDEQEGLKETIATYLNKQLDEEQKWDVRDQLISIAKEMYRESVQMNEADIVLDRNIIAGYIQAMQQEQAEGKEVTMEHLGELMLLSYIAYRIDVNEAENNSVLLAKTAHILHAALQPGDADFILEKAGIRYRHIMLDEFQDTSTLQWDNFLHLIQEILAGGGTTLIVGDIKQSIYRWRNGDWHIMASLNSNDPILGKYIEEESLITNYRSRKEVVRFNLEVFAKRYGEEWDEAHLENYYRKGSKEGGYVQLRWYPYSVARTTAKKDGTMPSEAVINLRSDSQKQACVEDMLKQIEEHLATGDKPQDMLILIRFKNQVDDILKAHQALTATGLYPQLATHRLVSNESYLLRASKSVQAIIAALQYVDRQDHAARHFVHLQCPTIDLHRLDELDKRMPLSFLMEEVIRICICNNGQYMGDDIAYLNCFKDRVREFVSQYGSSLTELLRYWDDEMQNDAIPSTDTGDIRIMTIHAAKGLEAKNVFVPFCNWKMEEDKRGTLLWCQAAHQPTDTNYHLKQVPISQNSQMIISGYAQPYQEEHDNQRLDNTNLLYVALTRAADRLYVYCPITYTAKVEGESTAAHLLLLDKEQLPNLKAMWEDWTIDKDRFAEWTAGDKTLPIHTGQKSGDTVEPFSFADASEEIATFFSENEHITFRQSQEAKNGNRDFGTLCHDIMAHIRCKADAPNVLNAFMAQGMIQSQEEYEHIEQELSHIWQHPQMADFFDEKWTIWSERTILPDDYRPDRVMVDETKKEAIVLDYKFGRMREEYYDQVKHYMILIHEMGYSVKGCIWLAKKQELLWIS